MPYQTGAASSPTDLIQKLITFLVANGWTQDMSQAEGSGWRVHAHLSSNYVHLRSAMNESTIWQQSYAVAHYAVHMYLGTGFNGSNAWNAQNTGAPIGTASNPMGVGMKLSAGPFSNYYFFCDSGGDNVAVVVERTPGLFVHLGWGSSLAKAGTWTGGAYFFGSSSGYYTPYPAGANTPGFTSTSDCPGVNADHVGGAVTFVRADVDAFTGKWIGIFNQSGVADTGATGKQGDSSVYATNLSMRSNFPVLASQAYTYHFQNMQTSNQDGRANLLPIYLWALRDSTTTGFSLLGSIPNVFCSNAVGHGFSNADEYLIGATTYKVFPNFAVVKS